MDVAKHIINKCVKDKHEISNIQLQQILYYIFREYIKKNKRLFEENFEMREFVFMIPNVYYSFCVFGSTPIWLEYETTTMLEKDDVNVIDNTVEELRDLPPWELLQTIKNQTTFLEKISRFRRNESGQLYENSL